MAPTVHNAPELPFHKLRPSFSVPSGFSSQASEDSALGVLAQVAHELETPTSPSKGDYFSNSNILPHDLAESLVTMYFLNFS